MIATRETLIWLVLVVLTLASWALGTHGGAVSDTTYAEGTLILIAAFFKLQMIVSNFMEVRHAPITLKVICYVWIVGAGGMVIAVYNDWLSFA